MTILGRGDLAPRRRRRRIGRVSGLLGVLLIVGAGGYAVWRFALHPVRGAGQSCVNVMVTPSPGPPVAASPRGIVVRILNGTDRNGLAHDLRPTLQARGFTVAAVGNAARPVAGAPQVVYGDVGEAAARLLAEEVVGATLKHDPALRGMVQLTITSGFTRLATPAEAKAAHTRDLAAASPQTVPTRSCSRA